MSSQSCKGCSQCGSGFRTCSAAQLDFFFFFLLLHLVKREVLRAVKKQRRDASRQEKQEGRTLRHSESRGSHSTFLRFHLPAAASIILPSRNHLERLSSCHNTITAFSSTMSVIPGKSSKSAFRSYDCFSKTDAACCSKITDKIGSLLFCPNCGSLLDVPATKISSSVLLVAPFRTPRVGLQPYRPHEQSRTRTDRISCRLGAWITTIAQFTTTSPL